MDLAQITTRREWLVKAGTFAIGGLLVPSIINSCGLEKKSNPTILVVSGWQDVNIGDIAHTPGLLNILQTYMPQAKIILWKKSKATKSVLALLKNNFPNVKIIYGNVDSNNDVSSEDVKEAFVSADILVHGSGPYIVGKSNIEAWMKNSDKPFGIFGVTIQEVNKGLEKIISNANFIYTRETKSLDVLKNKGYHGEHIMFAPDATFFMGLKDEKSGDSGLIEAGLSEKEFICVIPRLRYTPYHLIRENHGYTKDEISQREKVNATFKEKDHAKLRAAMIWWVRTTGNKVLVCPEMTYQVDIMDELLIDPLPEDVKEKVVKRGYWLPDEAASVYKKAFAVLSFECHSPIISLNNRTPSLYLRQPEDTIKGQMYYDLNFGDWVFEIEETNAIQIVKRLESIWNDYDSAIDKLAKSLKNINAIYEKATMKISKIIS